MMKTLSSVLSSVSNTGPAGHMRLLSTEKGANVTEEPSVWFHFLLFYVHVKLNQQHVTAILDRKYGPRESLEEKGTQTINEKVQN